ncbi:MAG: hypothetical protein IT260_21920 [Saprospiraceae bacterium]|nr:hypothetical protein [Saprospiraceae bacterium]
MRQLKVMFLLAALLGGPMLSRTIAQESFLLASADEYPTLRSMASANDYLDYKKKKKKKKKDSDYVLKDHLWYGAGLSLGFAGSNGASVFGLGVSPMVGYKIVGPLSIGPRLAVEFTSEKYAGYKAFNMVDLELSLFARVRVFKGLFVQGELGTVSDQYLTGNSQGQPVKTRQTRPAQYLGLGYNFANGEGGFGQEIAVLYDFYVADDVYTTQTPFQFRVAFTYGF